MRCLYTIQHVLGILRPVVIPINYLPHPPIIVTLKEKKKFFLSDIHAKICLHVACIVWMATPPKSGRDLSPSCIVPSPHRIPGPPVEEFFEARPPHLTMSLVQLACQTLSQRGPYPSASQGSGHVIPPEAGSCWTCTRLLFDPNVSVGIL